MFNIDEASSPIWMQVEQAGKQRVHRTRNNEVLIIDRHNFVIEFGDSGHIRRMTVTSAYRAMDQRLQWRYFGAYRRRHRTLIGTEYFGQTGFKNKQTALSSE